MQPFALGGGFDGDVIILDNVDEAELGISDALSTFAAEHGVLVLAGDGLRAGRTLGAILPLEPTGDRIVRDLALVLTEEGRGNPVFLDGARNLLAGSPPFWSALRSRSVRPDAVLWGKASDGTPLIAFRRNGNGKVLEVAGYPLWRVGFSATEGSHDDLYKLLRNLVRFLALKDVDRFRLSTDKLDYYTGEPISVMLQAVSDDGRPWSGLDVRLSLSPGGESTTSSATARSSGSGSQLTIDGRQHQLMIDRGNGLYEAEIGGLSSGQYTARAEVTLQDRAQGTAEHDFAVSELSIEMSQSPLNDELLRRIAAATGGAYTHFDSLAAHPLQFRYADYRRVVTFDPRLNRYLFLLVAALFVAEIFLRKRRGMM
jgi:hypothetical protein